MKSLFILLPAAFSVLGLTAYFLQDKLIYFPRPYTGEYLRDFAGRGGLILPFQAPHGAQTAFYLPPPGGTTGLPRRIWCCFAGNGGQALAWENFARIHGRDEIAFLFIEWPGYGASEGKPRAETIRASVRGSATALAAHLGVPPEDLQSRWATLGHSLGAAGALIAAGELDADRVILFSPFTSLRDMAVLQMGPVVGKFVSHDYDNRASLDRVAARAGTRVLILHGTEDEVIPVGMAEDLRERHPEQVELIQLPGARHNDLFGPAEPFLRTEFERES